jgi:hypothetical protein
MNWKRGRNVYLSQDLVRLQRLLPILLLVSIGTPAHADTKSGSTRNVRIGDVTLYIPPDFGFSVRLRANGTEPKRFSISRNRPIPDELKLAAGTVPRIYTITMRNCGRDMRERPPMDLPGLKHLKCITSSHMSESSSIDIRRLQSLQRAAVDPEIVNKYGPADAHGWIAWGVSSQGQTGQFISPKYYGRLGTPMSVNLPH